MNGSFHLWGAFKTFFQKGLIFLNGCWRHSCESGNIVGISNIPLDPDSERGALPLIMKSRFHPFHDYVHILFGGRGLVGGGKTLVCVDAFVVSLPCVRCRHRPSCNNHVLSCAGPLAPTQGRRNTRAVGGIHIPRICVTRS